jgi:predicted Zn-dependent protease
VAKHSTSADLESLQRRIAKLRANQNLEEALRLARKLASEQPSALHDDLFRDILLERAALLTKLGKQSEAIALLIEGTKLVPEKPDYSMKLAERLALCGELERALSLLARFPDSDKARAKLFTQLADAAVQQGPAGKAKLPADLHAGFDAVLLAFRHSEAARDDEARAALQPIGLQSPFLEWKMLLRGLLAYYANDDAKAAENWRRLDRARVSYQFAAPLWAAIDPEFCKSLSPSQQNVMQTKGQNLVGGRSQKLLQEIRASINRKSLATAFRAAENLLPVLKTEAPKLVPRLADCFRWFIIDQGHPDDLDRFLRVFGAPADDPRLHRLQAIALESRGLTHDAHEAWQAYLKDLEEFPAIFPKDQRPRAQAILWAHLGDNAHKEGESAPRGKRGSIFSMFAPERKPFKPSAEECYKKSLKLAPDQLEVYLNLFHLHEEKGSLAKAKKVGQDLLKRFPDHVRTLEALGDLHLQEGSAGEAVTFYARALLANPLERGLRGKLAKARRGFALEQTLISQFAEARQQLSQALATWDGPRYPLLCQQATVEMRAGDDAKAEELLAQARAEPNQRLACAYALAGEAVRAKLPKPKEKALADALKEELAQPATPEEILVLLESAAHQRAGHAEAFKGQKTLERLIVKQLEKFNTRNFDERQLERLCDQLLVMQLRGPWKKIFTAAIRRFPSNVALLLSEIDAELTAKRPAMYLFSDLLSRVRKLVEAMPRGEQQGQHLDAIKQREELVKALRAKQPLNPFDLLGGMFGFEDDKEDFR